MPGPVRIILDISPEEALILENDLEDITTWVNKAVAGKLVNCRKRLLNEWTPRLMKDQNVSMIPANEDSLISMIVTRPDYKNKKSRLSEGGL